MPAGRQRRARSPCSDLLSNDISGNPRRSCSHIDWVTQIWVGQVPGCTSRARERIGQVRAKTERGGLHAYVKRLGPGIITGAADDDPSGIGTYSQVGASMRFGLLWTALITLPLNAAVVELSARIGMVSGRGLAAVIRERYPTWIMYPTVLLVVLANIFNVGADLGSMTASLQLLVPVPYVVGLIVMAAVITFLQVKLPYERYATILRWLVLSLAAYVGVLFVVSVPWAEVLRSLVLPRFSADREYLAALIAIFGTTISPYLFFWQASVEVEEQADPTSATTRQEVRGMRGDVIAGAITSNVVMFAIIAAAAVTLGAHGGQSIGSADQAARALEPVAGRFASTLFTAGILGTGFLAVPVLSGSCAYALAELLEWNEGLAKRIRRAPGFYAVILAAMVFGIGLNFVGLNPIRALYFSAILNGLASPPILVLMLIASRSTLLEGDRSGWLSMGLVSIAALVMTILPLWYVLG